MINNINFNIQLDLQGLTNEEYLLILDLFVKNLTDENLNKTISLKELDGLLHLSSRKFITKSVEKPQISLDEWELDIRETNIEIIG